ncbi:hypothetical protein CRD36_12080 [Paremcibacter congregatus]|uniref:FAD-binding PCMH-type domain-containing protein n=2 Tax=Paremcibacter congregatus TaxID=2043170 RepID=A0A2G4YQQ0_9PROT|nr:hypothetical protein CRD36_12080 [Paremcibacter congregatus]QDE29329.1 FAD-binding protein [Paremcibacter congregatus]
MTQNKNSDVLWPALEQLLGPRLNRTDAVRRHHGEELTHFAPLPPDAVAWPQTTEEVSAIVKLCRAHDMPVIPYGAGTALEGHFLAPYGGLCLDFSQMKRILAVRAQDLDCTVEAGVTREELNQHLRDQGVFFPIDPGANASLGGMAATRASSTTAVAEQAQMVAEIAQDQGGADFKWATRPEDRTRLWAARHQGYMSVRAAYPGKDFWITDVCVPISRLADCLGETFDDIADCGLIAPLVGHVGDGNFHLTLPYDKTNAAEIDRLEAFNSRLIRRALQRGGTATGEHGVGLGKKKYMREEHGAALDQMKVIKRALDPTNILNPGKIFDLQETET